MKNIAEKMDSINGTVFLYCDPKDEKTISAFARAEESTGRQLFSREGCKMLDPALLAGTIDKKATFSAPSMMDFLDKYLSACPTGQQHLLIHARKTHEAIRSMSFPFHDFWEDRHIDIEDFYTDAVMADCEG